MAKQSQFVRYDTAQLNSIPITDVVGIFENVRRQGRTYVSLCPWHEDHTPSLVLYSGAGSDEHCHCFACGKGGNNISYVMQHEGVDFKGACELLSQHFGIGKQDGNVARPRPVLQPHRVVEEKPVEYTYIPMSFLQPLLSVENSLCRCMMRYFDPEKVKWIAEEYMLGRYEWRGKEDCTVFPTIDVQGRICNLKVQGYCTDPDSPDFGHWDHDYITQLGSILSTQGTVIPKGAVFDSKCLFGAHLLPRYPSAEVALVESPKNALFGAAMMPEMVWVAAGSKSNLNRRTLEALRERRVFVFADRDAIQEWRDTLKGMADIAPFVVSDFCERFAPADAPKFDIADYAVMVLG